MTFSLLPDCLASRLPGTLLEVEQAVDRVEGRQGHAGGARRRGAPSGAGPGSGPGRGALPASAVPRRATGADDDCWPVAGALRGPSADSGGIPHRAGVCWSICARWQPRIWVVCPLLSDSAPGQVRGGRPFGAFNTKRAPTHPRGPGEPGVPESTGVHARRRP